jgi:hypothetical protein
MILQRRIQKFCVLLFLLLLSQLHAMERLNHGEDGDSPTEKKKTPNLKEKSTEEEKKNSCVICFEAIEANESFKWPFCTHEFHKECANEWMKISQTCPLCRTHNGEKPKRIDLSAIGDVVLIDPETFQLLEENIEVRQMFLDKIRIIINRNRSGGRVSGVCVINTRITMREYHQNEQFDQNSSQHIVNHGQDFFRNPITIILNANELKNQNEITCLTIAFLTILI